MSFFATFRDPWVTYLKVSLAKEGKMLGQKNYCSVSWEPLREFTGGVLFLFPQVQLWRSTLMGSVSGNMVNSPLEKVIYFRA